MELILEAILEAVRYIIPTYLYSAFVRYLYFYSYRSFSFYKLYLLDDYRKRVRFDSYLILTSNPIVLLLVLFSLGILIPTILSSLD